MNILLHELEQYEGVVIFATNLAANFDPADLARIRFGDASGTARVTAARYAIEDVDGDVRPHFDLAHEVLTDDFPGEDVVDFSV